MARDRDNLMATVSSIAEHIEITPGTCGGKPRIAGTRVRVQDVVIWHDRMGLSPEEIVAEYPQVTLADVHAALAYYHDHRDEVRAFIDEEERLAAELEARQPSLADRNRARRDVQNDPVPPR